MDFFELYMLGLPLVFNPYVILMLLIGVISGISIGALPGLTATMGVAIITPITFGLNTQAAFALLLGVYCGGIYGGSITAVMVKIPGTPSAMMTVLDGYPMAQRGEAGIAIGVATISSFIGGLISVFILAIFAPLIAKIALTFGPSEYFGISFFGLSIIAYVSTGSMIKGVLSGLLGLLLSCIGMDPISGYPRYTFGSLDLLGGLALLPMLIGIFGLAEVFILSEKQISNLKINKQIGRILPKWNEFKRIIPTILRSAPLGVFIGAIPAAGGTIAGIVSYGFAKRISKYPKKFGTGILEGIAAPETANNASTGGAMIPMLTLGIPGDAITAILIGALLIQGLRPGPLLFQNNPEVVSSIFILMALANFFFLILGLLGARLVSKVITTPYYLMIPAILALCIVGSYSIRNSKFDIAVLIIFGIIGYFFDKGKVPAAPLVLGFILGPIVESNLRRSFIISNGSFTIFFEKPITLFFMILTFIVLILPLIKNRKKYKESIDKIL